MNSNTNSSKLNEISERIQKQVELDQAIRLSEPIDYDEMKKIDDQSRPLIYEFLENFGYPSIKEFGEDLSSNMWLLVQHAYEDHDLQIKYLKMMENAAEPENKRRQALLTDRTLMFEDKKQIYGSQFQMDDSGNWVLYQVQDPQNLNKRRAEMGMEPVDGSLIN